MRKFVPFVLALLCVLVMAGCTPKGRTVNLEFRFEIDDIEYMEMYHYNSNPELAEKKVVENQEDIREVYQLFERLSLENRTGTGIAAEPEITSFRFCLADGTSYELIYSGYGVKNGELSSPNDSFRLFTSALQTLCSP